jgi:ubiquitin-protein ligase
MAHVKNIKYLVNIKSNKKKKKMTCCLKDCWKRVLDSDNVLENVSDFLGSRAPRWSLTRGSIQLIIKQRNKSLVSVQRLMSDSVTGVQISSRLGNGVVY